MTILLIEDDKRLAEFIVDSLPEHHVISVFSLAKAKEIVNIIKPIILIIDLGLPDSGGLDTLAAFKSFNGPKIVITGQMDDLSESAIKLGATDYIKKATSLDEIMSRIKFNIQKLKKKERFRPEIFSQIQAVLIKDRELVHC